MSSSTGTGTDYRPTFFDHIEEAVMALLLGVMTLITFANVIARYAFNDNILWALETTVFLFAWLVLLGATYGVKKNLHLGVDMLTAKLAPAARRAVALVAVAICFAFSLLLLKASWDYWWPFASTRAFYEVDDVPMPGFLQFFADWLNEGERYEKMPRFIPYFILPLASALLVWRYVQVAWRVLRDKQHSLIVAHEAEAAMEQLADVDSSPDEPVVGPRPGGH